MFFITGLSPESVKDAFELDFCLSFGLSFSLSSLKMLRMDSQAPGDSDNKGNNNGSACFHFSNLKYIERYAKNAVLNARTGKLRHLKS